MDPGRRALIASTGAIVTPMLLDRPIAARSARPAVVFFDGLVLFDVRPIAVRLEQLFPGHGQDLARLVRVRQFEYSWLRASAGRYRDFLGVTEDALVFAARSLELELTSAARAAILDGFSSLPVHADVPAGLERLRGLGMRLAVLSNFTPRMLSVGLARSGVARHFTAALSTDRIRSYKPDPRAYRLGLDELGVRRENALFVASAGWDAAGAKWFGYPTYLMNRAGDPKEALEPVPDATVRDFAGLVALLRV